MKVQKLFTIDSEISERLKKVDNASRLVNRLLRIHFGENAGKECEHQWSNWAANPGGLCRECLNCHKVEFK